jgi:hypothetical protein
MKKEQLPVAIFSFRKKHQSLPIGANLLFFRVLRSVEDAEGGVSVNDNLLGSFMSEVLKV